MIILKEDMFPISEPVALALGFFDGLHRGHCELISNIVRNRKEKSVIYTFDKKYKQINRIYTEEQKIQLLTEMNVDFFYSATFDERFAALSPEEFLADLHARFLNIRNITVGFDFRFGKNAEGNTSSLYRNAQQHNYDLTIIAPVQDTEGIISSSRIRSLIHNRNYESAAQLLGRSLYATP